MKKVKLDKAKTNLSKLIELAHKGEEIIICKAGKPVAKLVPLVEQKRPRKDSINNPLHNT